MLDVRSFSRMIVRSREYKRPFPPGYRRGEIVTLFAVEVTVCVMV
jgi:hypothetical protein